LALQAVQRLGVDACDDVAYLAAYGRVLGLSRIGGSCNWRALRRLVGTVVGSWESTGAGGAGRFVGGGAVVKTGSPTGPSDHRIA